MGGNDKPLEQIYLFPSGSISSFRGTAKTFKNQTNISKRLLLQRNKIERTIHS